MERLLIGLIILAGVIALIWVITALRAAELADDNSDIAERMVRGADFPPSGHHGEVSS